MSVHALLVSHACLWSRTDKGPSWLWYCETERKKGAWFNNAGAETRACDLAVTRQAFRHRWRDGPNCQQRTGLWVQIAAHIGRSRFSCTLGWTTSACRGWTPPTPTPSVQAPGSSQLSSKHFPSQRSNRTPSDRPLGLQTRDQVQRWVQRDARLEWRESWLKKIGRSLWCSSGGCRMSWCFKRVVQKCWSEGAKSRGVMFRKQTVSVKHAK